MASGFNGQNFAFVGYLPIDRKARIQRLKQLEGRAVAENQTQIFIEAPYRNNQLLQDIFSTLQPMQISQIIQNLEKEMKAFDRFSKKVYNKSSNNIEGEVSWQLKIS